MPELVCAASDRPAWLAARRAGVTATDIVTILGLSPYDSPYSLYYRKLGEVPEVPDNDRFRLGRYLEHYVIERWLWDHPESSLDQAQGLYRSTIRPWQMATPDGLLPGAVFEAKTTADIAGDQWGQGIPPAVRAQVLWQMDVMDVPAGHVGVVFLPSGEFASHTIEHDGHGMTAPPWPGARRLASDQQSAAYADEMAVRLCDACTDLAMMRSAGEEFMARLRGELPPPDPDASMATLAAVRARFPKRDHKRGVVDETTWAAWADARDVIKHWEGKARKYEALVREELGECDEIEAGGQLVGRRVVCEAKIKAHVQHRDYIMRLKSKENGDD